MEDLNLIINSRLEGIQELIEDLKNTTNKMVDEDFLKKALDVIGDMFYKIIPKK